MSRYKYPKFKRGDKVQSPAGEGTVYVVQYVDGIHWYELEEAPGFYREDELKRVEKR